LSCPLFALPYVSVAFELQHNVCGRRVYAEGTCDAVEFLHRAKKQGGSKRLFNMIDVLEAGAMK
jgi:4-hydroxy-tetrahydrodipicolinate reductase